MRGGWLFLIFLALASPSLYLWQRATYRLQGSLGNFDPNELNSRNRRRFMAATVGIFGLDFVLLVGTVIAMLVFPPMRDFRGGIFASMILLFGLSFVKFGFINVIVDSVVVSRDSAAAKFDREIIKQ